MILEIRHLLFFLVLFWLYLYVHKNSCKLTHESKYLITPRNAAHPFKRKHYISSVLTYFTHTKVVEGQTLSALTCNCVPERYRLLPVVDVGAHDGKDYTIPAAKLAHRVYSNEPTFSK